MPEKPRDSATTREAILDAAQRVMHTLGLANTTTREIALAAGLSEAALYKHFDDKTDLFLCVLRERLPDLSAALRDLPNRVGQRTVRANLEDLTHAVLAFYRDSAPFAASLFSRPELLARHQEHMRASGGGPHRARDLLADYLRAEQRAGRVAREANPQVAALLLIGACLQRAFIGSFVGAADTQQDDARFVKDVVRFVMRALKSH
ncbi:MAG TPA: TetR/AcrR family transcriptional regulator [Chloroflexota bacterium]